MAALRSIDIIEGTPALRAVALRALVLRAGHQIWVIESTSTRAIVAGVRAGTRHEQQSVWTIDRAKAAQLTGKPNWSRHPAAMLIARATAEVARLIAPDVLLGLPYVVEELADGDSLDPEPAPEPIAPRRAIQRKQRTPSAVPLPTLPPTEPVAEPEPPTEAPEPVPDPEPAPDPLTSRATDDQLRAARRAMIARGLGTTRKQLDYASTVTGRPIEHLSDLFAAEAITVIREATRDDDPDTDEWSLIGGADAP